VFSVALVMLLQAGTAGVTGQGTVTGAVRSEATGAAIARARIELLDAPLRVESDTAGGYELRGIAPGTHRLRFAARGYRPLEVDVLFAGDAPLHLDIALAQEPAQLAPVTVLGTRGEARATDHAGAPTEGGTWSVSGQEVRESAALDDADAFRLLATAPQAQMMAESPASVHVRGGSADQNLFLLDGAPVFSPVHPGQLLSAFSPDIVDGLVLHGGAPSARYGGRLSSIVDVQTPAAIPDAVGARGAFGPTAVRSALDIPLVPAHAGLTLSARHSYSGLRREDAAELDMPGTWSDLFGKVALRFAGNAVTLSSFTSDNGLGFPSGGASRGAGVIDGGDLNRFSWTSTTHAAGWRRPLGARATVETRLWSARFVGEAGWAPDIGVVAVRNELRDDGMSTVLSAPHGTGRLSAGLEMEHLSTRYDVARMSPTPGAGAGAPTLRLSSAPVVRSVFAEDERHPGDAWTLTTGIRGTIPSRSAPRIEPRVSVAFAPSPRLGISTGYARMHQYSQSLSNEESVLGTIVGPDLLVAIGSPSVPVARSDEFAAAAMVALGAHTRLHLDWYARRLHGLILVAPSTSAPFATDGYEIGRGRAWGAGTTIERRTDRLTLQGGYAVGAVTRRTEGGRYRPSFAPSQSASFALAWQLATRTRLRSVIWATTGRLTTPISDEIGWDTRDAFSGSRELSGTPEHTVGSLNGAVLPTYLRVDLGVRHTMPVWRSRGTFTGFASLNNALRRRNTAAYVIPGGTGARRDLVMLPLSAMLGLEWRY
jgi:hypothetical protein